MWMIKSLKKLDNHGQPKYWSNGVGWTWKDAAEVFTEQEKQQMSLPRNSEWEEVEPYGM